MSTLFSLVVAVVANLLTIIGVPQDSPSASGVEIMKCKHYVHSTDAHFILKNEQLSKKIN